MTFSSEQREEVRRIATEAITEKRLEWEREQSRRQTDEATWRAKVEQMLEHIVDAVDELKGDVNHADNGARPRVRTLEEKVRTLEAAAPDGGRIASLESTVEGLVVWKTWQTWTVRAILVATVGGLVKIGFEFVRGSGAG